MGATAAKPRSEAEGPGPMKVVVTDTEGGRWEQSFETTTASN